VIRYRMVNGSIRTWRPASVAAQSPRKKRTTRLPPTRCHEHSLHLEWLILYTDNK
jgi:hypothetical protein